MLEHLEILVIEDDELDYQLLERHLRNHITCRCYRVDNPRLLQEALRTQAWDLVLSDYSLPALDIRETLRHVMEELPDTPIILLSGTIGEEEAIDLLKAGVEDFVNKDKLTRLIPAIERGLREAKVHKAHKQAEWGLRYSEERYRTLVEQLPDIIYTAALDEAFTTQYVSPQIEHILGFSPEEVLAIPAFFTKRMHPEDRERVLGEVRQSLRQNTPFRSEYRIAAKDGHTVWLHDEAHIIQPGAGRPQILLGVMRDITQHKHAEQELARVEAEWTQAMDQFDVAIFLLDMNRRLLRANSAFYRMINIDAEHCLGRNIMNLLHPNGEQKPCPMCQAIADLREGVTTMEPGEYNNPTGCPIEITLKLIRNTSGAATGILMAMHDLSRARQTEQRLRQSAIVFESTAEGVFITDSEANILDTNRAFTEITGYERSEALGADPKILKSGRHDENFYHDMWHSINETGRWRGEIWNRRKDGSLYPAWLTISSVLNGEGKLTNYVAVFSDISSVKHSQEQMVYLAHHDALTGLPNRLLFHARLDHALKHAERNHSMLAVIFLDLDRFKNINDSLGHPAGDTLLKQVAKVLVHSVRLNDTVARIGGDEFVMVLENIREVENAAKAAEKLMLAFTKPFALEGQEIHVSASMGISIYPRHGEDASTLLRNADAAMYRAKEEGRNTYQFYTRQLTKIAYERVLLENNLRRALELDELRLLFQPQVDLHTGHIVGAEALVRWQHPELGIVSPAKFIPVAEDCGLIHIIGNWVLHTACAKAEQWLKNGLDFGHIAVNVAGRQLQRGGVVNSVKAALDQSGLSLSMLELEVTENFIMREAEHAIDQLEALRKLGVVLAIDDFGTGYSSLSYLKRLPINKLKIDQSFVHDIPADPNDMAISNAVIALGKSLQMTVIAEGVETEEQAQFLRKAGCHEAQGYLYSRPVTAEKFEVLLDRQS